MPLGGIGKAAFPQEMQHNGQGPVQSPPDDGESVVVGVVPKVVRTAAWSHAAVVVAVAFAVAVVVVAVVAFVEASTDAALNCILMIWVVFVVVVVVVVVGFVVILGVGFACVGSFWRIWEKDSFPEKS